MGFIPNKPSNTKFVFKNLNSTQYKIYAKQYSTAKAGGIRCTYCWISGVGIVEVVTDFGKGIVIDYTKRKFAAVCIGVSAYFVPPAFIVFTNASKIVNVSKSVHSTASFCFECAEDLTNLAFLPLDLALFGQPIPIGAGNRFNLFNDFDDFFDI
jgi:hypothetical protein